VDLICHMSKESLYIRGPLRYFVTSFLRWGVVIPIPNSQAGGPPLVDCPLLLIQHISSYRPCMEAVFSIGKPNTRYTVVTRDLVNVGAT
jgi:hypothetical protein